LIRKRGVENVIIAMIEVVRRDIKATDNKATDNKIINNLLLIFKYIYK